MANQKVTDLAALGAAPDVADQFIIVDVSDTTMSAQGTNKKLAASRVARSNADATLITGDGKTVTVPATGTAAMLGVANTFTETQTITPDSNASPLSIYPYATGAAGMIAIYVHQTDNGNSVGPRIQVRNNNNASTPAAGVLSLEPKTTGGMRYIWPDSSGLMRVHTSQPTNATDTAGTVIGDQTSNAAFKTIVGDPVSDADALANLVAAADMVKRFVYTSGAYNDQEFSGVVLSGSELLRYGKDAETEYPAGKSLNDVNLFGDIVLALREIERRLTALESA